MRDNGTKKGNGMTPTVSEKVGKVKALIHEQLEAFYEKRTTGHLAVTIHTKGGCPQFIDFSAKVAPKDVRKL